MNVRRTTGTPIVVPSLGFASAANPATDNANLALSRYFDQRYGRRGFLKIAAGGALSLTGLGAGAAYRVAPVGAGFWGLAAEVFLGTVAEYAFKELYNGITDYIDDQSNDDRDVVIEVNQKGADADFTVINLAPVFGDLGMPIATYMIGHDNGFDAMIPIVNCGKSVTVVFAPVALGLYYATMSFSEREAGVDKFCALMPQKEVQSDTAFSFATPSDRAFIARNGAGGFVGVNYNVAPDLDKASIAVRSINANEDTLFERAFDVPLRQIL